MKKWVDNVDWIVERPIIRISKLKELMCKRDNKLNERETKENMGRGREGERGVG